MRWRPLAALVTCALVLAGCSRSAVEAAPRSGSAPPAAPAPPPGLASASTGAPPDDGERADRRTPVVRTVERVASAVVNISTETLVKNPYYGRSSVFDYFYGGAEAGPRERYVANSLGSGVMVDARGYVVTNEHVVAAASRITVTFLDGKQLSAHFVGSASEYDLAVLQVDQPGPYPFVSVDFKEPLYPGETVIAIGNPFGLQSSVTTGILSGTQRRVQSGGSSYTDFLQTDAAINPGNSGGALLTINGDLIGINTQIDARGQNLGFAIPVARVRKVFDELVRYGEVRNVWLGADPESLDLDPEAAAKLGVPGGRGLVVRTVFADSPAGRAGIEPGDVITAIDGDRVRDYAEFHTALSRIKVGDTMSLDVWRGGASRRVQIQAETFPLARGADLAWRSLGLKVQKYAARGGDVLIVSDVREGGPADRIGFHRNLVVLGVDDEPLATAEAFYRALIARIARRSILLDVSDGEATYRVPIPLQE